MAAIFGRHIPHCPGHDDEREDPRPRRDRRGRFDTCELEGISRTALIGIDQDWHAAANDLLLAQPDHRDPRPVADDERNRFFSRWFFAARCADVQHVRSVFQSTCVELEFTRWFEGDTGLALVVDEDVYFQSLDSSSSRMRHFTWLVHVSPG